jgi:hypothetical protein
MASPSPDDRSAQPLDPELWDLTRAAVQSAGATADAHLAAGGFRPRVGLPSVSNFPSGWPNLTGAWLFPPDDAPTDYSQLFSFTVDTLHPVAYADVPELVALIDYVSGRQDLKSRLHVPSATGKTEFENRLFAYEVADLPLSLLDRARAIGPASDDDLLLLYLERERAWLLDPLPVEYIIPLALTALDLDAGLIIDDDTRLEPLDTAMQAARAPERLRLSTVPDPVVSAATHAIFLSGRELPNPGPGQRMFDRFDQALPLDDADLVCQALRILSDVEVGYAQVLSRPLGWADGWVHDLPPVATVRTLRHYPEWFDNYAWLREPNPIERTALEALPGTVTALRAAPPHIGLAARRLSLAATRPADDDRTVDACIGLEALLSEGRDELSHRLALRAATALGTRSLHRPDPQTIYEAVKKVYAHRSAVVHGTPGDKSRTLTLEGRTYVTADVAVLLLRAVLADALSRPGGWTPKTLDSALLAALAQSADRTEASATSASPIPE